MDSEQINVLNTELIKEGLKNSFYQELRHNRSGWTQNMYKFLATCNPVYAVIGAFSIDDPQYEYSADIYSFNLRWTRLCFEFEWVGQRLSKYNADDFIYVLDLMYGVGKTNNGYSPVLDAKDIVCALEVVEFAKVTGFIPQDRTDESFEVAQKIVLSAIKRHREAKKESPGTAHEEMFSVFDEEERRRKEEEEARAREEAKLNEERKSKLTKVASRVVSSVNKYDWGEAARDTINLVNMFNEMFTRSDLGLSEDKPSEPKDTQESHKTDQETSSETAHEPDPEYSKTSNTLKGHGRLGIHGVSMTDTKSGTAKFSVNTSLGEFLTRNGYIYVSMCEIDEKLFIYFSKRQLTNVTPIELCTVNGSYLFHSVSFAAKIRKHFNEEGVGYGVLTISDNLSKNLDSRHMEILSYTKVTKK